jgi:hypothetical protein
MKEDMRNAYKVSVVEPEGKNYLGVDLAEDGRIKLKWILRYRM